MFYKQFSKIINALNPEFVESFDYWLATLPENNRKNITASVVSARLGVKYHLAEMILKFAEQEKILEKYYLVKCPDCDYNLASINSSELADVLVHPLFCCECYQEKHISPDDIYTAYKILCFPDISEDEIAAAIEQKLQQHGFSNLNFTKADSLSVSKESLYDAFYQPSESAYKEFKELQSHLDTNYGCNTTQKGKALEILILKIFDQIKYVRSSNDVKTQTNQLDCTMLCGLSTSYPSIFNILSPYFVVECKNEKKKPDNTYMNKLESIMATNDAQLGIVFGRKDATSACFQLAREHYLLNKNGTKQKIVITCSDTDLSYIVDKKVNLLQYLEYKVFQITANSPKATFEMFSQT